VSDNQAQQQGQNQQGQNQQGQNQQGQNRRRQQKRQRPPKRKPVDLWRPVPQLPDPEPIVPAADPTALVRSLGDPPLQGQGQVAEHYLAAVVERAAGLATALAAAGGLLGSRDDD
jgi:uncharacterized Zn finger protein